MATKCTGEEFKQFIRSEWLEGEYVDEALITVNGVEVEDYDLSEINSSDRVMIILGDIYNNEGYVRSFVAHFRRWRKQQNTVYLAVEVSIEEVELMKAVILAAGGKIK